MTQHEFRGLLVIGDPHLEGRQPGFRKDDYPQVILDKLKWCLDYAREARLLPLILGDLFDKPRDNPNWMMDALFNILEGPILGIYGNHDVHYQPELTEHDSLSLLVSAGRIRLVSREAPWVGHMNNRPVIIGGASYRQAIPREFDPGAFVDSQEEPFVVWMTHHDLLIPGYDEGRIKPIEIEGIDVVINGHIHRQLETISAGLTQWLTPGNISRRSRNDATKDHIPRALQIDVAPGSWTPRFVEVPHAPFEDVFHDAVIETVEPTHASAFVAGLSELQSRRTSSGAGLKEFLKQNVDQFDKNVAAEIWKLADEISGE